MMKQNANKSMMAKWWNRMQTKATHNRRIISSHRTADTVEEDKQSNDTYARLTTERGQQD